MSEPQAIEPSEAETAFTASPTVSTEGFDHSRWVLGDRAAAMMRAGRECELYIPCDCGIHVCGANEEDNYCWTVANFPALNDEAAERIFEQMKEECSVEREAADFCIDLNLHLNGKGGHVRDFWSNLQLLPRLAAIAESAA